MACKGIGKSNHGSQMPDSGESGNGGVSASLTGLYPWGRYALGDRLSVWGLAGYGEGTLRLTRTGRRQSARTSTL